MSEEGITVCGDAGYSTTMPEQGAAIVAPETVDEQEPTPEKNEGVNDD
jgi:hypothetical protein